MRCHQISSVTVSVEPTEFLDKIFNMPIFKQKFYLFKISKKLNFGLKIGILKMLSKNSVSSTHTATLEF